MATAGLKALEEHITCGVCLEVYTNPQILKCLHVFCQACVQGVKQGDTVRCPKCREYTKVNDIKSDFNMANLIAIQKAPRDDSPPVQLENVCNVCEETDKPVVSSCMQKSTQQEISELTGFVRDQKDKVDGNVMGTEKLISDIRLAGKRQVSQVEKQRDSIIEQVKKHHNSLIEQINAANQETLDSLEQQKRLLTKARTKLKTKTEALSNVSQRQSYYDTLTKLREEIKPAVEEICSRLPKFDPNIKSTVSVVEGCGWFPEKSTKVETAETNQKTRDRLEWLLKKQPKEKAKSMSSVFQEQEIKIPVDYTEGKAEFCSVYPPFGPYHRVPISGRFPEKSTKVEVTSTNQKTPYILEWQRNVEMQALSGVCREQKKNIPVGYTEGSPQPQIPFVSHKEFCASEKDPWSDRGIHVSGEDMYEYFVRMSAEVEACGSTPANSYEILGKNTNIVMRKCYA